MMLASLSFLLLIIISFFSTTQGMPLVNEDWVQVDRLAQHMASHWHFDHLEPLASESYAQVSTMLLQDHLDLDLDPRDEDDNVDHGVLKAQVIEGVQSYLQGTLLPSVWWDAIAQPLLNPTALAALVRTSIDDHCPSQQDNNTVPSACLINHSRELGRQLDEHVSSLLNQALDELDSRVVPDVLAQTAALLDRMQITTTIKKPWQPKQLMHRLPNPVACQTHSFTRYLYLARVQ
ncbi:hypothetical protein K492DRAFT_170269 [Lichtheimia hyalospora FSU 10163]|nr:hypothetical protein K492DRAFT_170269 [Lichtheimia hyalospora FSU 10163]